MLRRAAAAVCVAVMSACIAGAATAQPLRTAIYPQVELNANAENALAHTKSAGATFVRLTVYWSSIAPKNRSRGFDPASPADPRYSWGTLDNQLRAAARAHLVPVLTILGAPAWAQSSPAGTGDESNRPRWTQFALFMKAIGTRYDGHFQGLPRVRYWEIWNEPNLTIYLQPQLNGTQPQSPGMYRRLVNAAAVALKKIHKDNFVVAGSLAPFRDITPSVLRYKKDWGPLAFMRDVLCLSSTLQKTCGSKIEFDGWSMHPYTSGGPSHHAAFPNDLSLGDLPKVKPILAAAWRHKTILAPRFPQMWVTEFSWDSSPPDPKGVPTALLDHWVPEALYKMWSAGVSVVTWYSLFDQSPSTSVYQSGLYYVSGKPKPYLTAFRFPLVAVPQGGGLRVWGRVPPNAKGSVVVEQRTRSSWRRLGVVRSNADGIFSHTFATAAKGFVRAHAVKTGASSLQYSVAEPPDRFYNPFGLPTLLEPKAAASKQKK